MTTLARQGLQEEELVRRVQAGDDGAFDRLVELCGPRVYSLAYRLVGNSEDAQDIAQEAFVRVYQAIPRFRQDAAFATWLHRIVLNACHDELARRKRRPLAMTELAGESDEEAPPARELADDGDTPETAVLRWERQNALQRALAELPETFRMVVILHDVQGLDYREIAGVLHVELGTVKSRLNRARNLLREKISADRELFFGAAGQSG